MEKLLQIRQVFLDMDGTIYHGNTLFPTTIPFLNFLKERKIGFAFLSNNSSLSIPEYVEKLVKMGIKAGEKHFYTSTEYTIDYLKEKHPEIKRVTLLAMKSIEKEFQQAGFEIDRENPQAVVIAFDRSLTYEKLCRVAYFLHQGIPGFATHPDVFCPTDQKTWLVDCGAITKALEVSTNKKIKVLGKPDPGMLKYAAQKFGVGIHQCLMIGDRLSTDIALGVNAGAASCQILSPGADLTVPEGIVPDYKVHDLGELQSVWKSFEMRWSE